MWRVVERTVCFRQEPQTTPPVHVSFLCGAAADDHALLVVRATGAVELHDTGNKTLPDTLCRLAVSTVAGVAVSRDVLFVAEPAAVHVVCLRTRRLLCVLDAATLFGSEVTASGSEITALASHFRRNDLAVVCRNRSVRVFSPVPATGQFAFRFKFQDAVNKWPWRMAGFSHHGEADASLGFATVAAKGRHLVHVWENGTGAQVQVLEGPKEEVSAAVWHPRRPQLITVGAQSGHVYIWGPDFVQRWAALVPNVEAIETNIEYLEREDEFDLRGEGEMQRGHEQTIDVREFARNINRASASVDDCGDDADLHTFYPLE